MKRFKQWLYSRFLPAWCRDDLIASNKRLTAMIGEQKEEIVRLKAYINGLESAMRAQRRVIIHTGEVKR